GARAVDRAIPSRRQVDRGLLPGAWPVWRPVSSPGTPRPTSSLVRASAPVFHGSRRHPSRLQNFNQFGDGLFFVEPDLHVADVIAPPAWTLRITMAGSGIGA